jgi:hypothetical protein
MFDQRSLGLDGAGSMTSALRAAAPRECSSSLLGIALRRACSSSPGHVDSRLKPRLSNSCAPAVIPVLSLLGPRGRDNEARRL